MNNIFDSHAHYNAHAFDNDRDELLTALKQSGVVNIVNIAAEMDDSEDILKLVEKYDYIYGALGVHPEAVDRTPDNFTETLEKQILSQPKIKAIGEIGLDYHYEGYSKENQKKIFVKQLELAKKLDMPVVIHSRDACEDTMEILREYRPNGVMHCFGYSAEIAEEIINMGMYISFTGVITFKNAKKAVRALQTVPTDRLMLETDCPYMAPEPYRGKRCNSSMIEHTASKAAEIFNMQTQELLDITCANAKRFFNIK
ncbi:MAG: TatD family hydrolase [Oscillospiraceae bacterium]|nr:TatD family hydrolase [Oscillospiraceae bacterium]